MHVERETNACGERVNECMWRESERMHVERVNECMFHPLEYFRFWAPTGDLQRGATFLETEVTDAKPLLGHNRPPK